MAMRKLFSVRILEPFYVYMVYDMYVWSIFLGGMLWCKLAWKFHLYLHA